jgi:hypothetical protein
MAQWPYESGYEKLSINGEENRLGGKSEKINWRHHAENNGGKWRKMAKRRQAQTWRAWLAAALSSV